VLIHFFGVVRDAARFHRLAQAHGALTIEDLAHVHALGDMTIGATGDVVLYSFPKILGVPDGAALVVRSAIDPRVLRYRRDPRTPLYTAGQVINVAMTGLSRAVPGTPTRVLRRAAAYATVSYRLLMSFYHHPTRMSRVAHWLLARTPWERIRTHRRSLEQLYDEGLDQHAFERFTPASNKTTHASMGFPVRVRERCSLVESLASRGMHGVFFEYKWNYFPPDPVHDDGRALMHDHFLFPTAFSLDAAEVQSVISAANEWARRRRE
jgi:dTDP-4-amino-4,6-dideoxygalactose transaminase